MLTLTTPAGFECDHVPIRQSCIREQTMRKSRRQRTKRWAPKGDEMSFAEISKNMLEKVIAERERCEREQSDGGVEENPRTETESKIFGLKEKEWDAQGILEMAVQKVTKLRFLVRGAENSDDGK